MFGVLRMILLSWVLFIAVSIMGGGGDQFRSLNEKSGLLSEKITDMIASKADSLKAEADAMGKKVKKWTGIDKETSGDPEPPKKQGPSVVQSRSLNHKG